MDKLETISDEIRAHFERVDEVRERALHRSRQLITGCSRAIRAVHREEWARAEELLAQVRQEAEELVRGAAEFPDIYHAGYTQDALKEYVEAHLTYALVRHHDLPTPGDLQVEPFTWLNGLAEAATELRRRILDIIRHGHSEEAEYLLDVMDNIYGTLVTFDFKDSITGGLRRRTDLVRGVLERTRGDVTTSLRQAALEEALKAMELRLRQE